MQAQCSKVAMSRNIINSVFSDSSECNDREDDWEYLTVAHENETEAAAAGSLIPSTHIQMDGSVTVHTEFS